MTMEIVEFCRLRSIRFDPFVIRISKLLPFRAGAHDTVELTRFRGHLIVLLTDEEVYGEYSETNRGAGGTAASPTV
jgi:hypothetical protein